VGFRDPRDCEPIVDQWDGLTRLLSADAGKVIDEAISSGVSADIDMNGIDVDDPDGSDLTEAKIKRLMDSFGLDRETVMSLWGPQGGTSHNARTMTKGCP